VTDVGFLIGSATGSPTADVRIETVDSSMNPSGTLFGTNTNAISATLTNGWNTVTLTAAASIPRGSIFAVKIVYNSGTSFQTKRKTDGLRNGLPFHVTNVTGSAVKSSVCFLMALGSSPTDWYAIPGMAAEVTTQTITFNNSVAGAKRGLRFKVPVACRCAGFQIGQPIFSGDFNLRLEDDSGAELSGSSIAVDGSVGWGAVGYYYFFDNPVDLDANTWYRVSIEPTTGTNVQFFVQNLPSADYRHTLGWDGGNCQYFTHTTAGGFDDSDTDTVPFCFLLLDQIETPAARAYVIGG
jgi:hypothetical protein